MTDSAPKTPPAQPRVVSVNISTEKGVPKKPCGPRHIGPNGLEGDAHAGFGHRQVSLLSQESIQRFAQHHGREIRFGEFAENITLAGIDLTQVRLLDRFHIGNTVLLEVTQIGKKCHGDNCAIFQAVGQCVMPQEGIFSRVLTGGEIEPGDTVTHQPYTLKALVITVSDRAAQGAYEDHSGPMAEAMLSKHFIQSKHWRLEIERQIIADEPESLRTSISEAYASAVGIIITTGGTGIGPRDITPDVITPMLDAQLPGIMDHVRLKYGAAKPGALLSRSIAGVLGSTLIFALPGSPRAVDEYLTEILPLLEHMLFMVRGIDRHG